MCVLKLPHVKNAQHSEVRHALSIWHTKRITYWVFETPLPVSRSSRVFFTVAFSLHAYFLTEMPRSEPGIFLGPNYAKIALRFLTVRARWYRTEEDSAPLPARRLLKTSDLCSGGRWLDSDCGTDALRAQCWCSHQLIWNNDDPC